VRVVGDVGRALERHVAVSPPAAVVGLAQEPRRVAHVGEREREEQGLRVANAGGEQLLELRVVVVAGAQGRAKIVGFDVTPLSPSPRRSARGGRPATGTREVVQPHRDAGLAELS
jgi:hypothetical protein